MTKTRTPSTSRRRTTPDQQAGGIVAALEYREMDRWASATYMLAFLLFLGVLWQGGAAGGTFLTQLVTQTDIVRPLPPGNAAWLRRQHLDGTPPTAQQLSLWTPNGWALTLPGAVQRCAERPKCAAYLRGWALSLYYTPEIRKPVEQTESLLAAAMLAALLASTAGRTARGWRSWERDQIAAQTQRPNY